MKKFLYTLTLIYAGHAISQVPEDALRYSWLTNNSTARNMAVGGVMGSLGGDITATFSNPAGIGFFKTNEVVITPGFQLLRSKINYRDSLTRNEKNAFQLGPTGVIIALNDKYQTKQSAAISIAINQTANFTNDYKYSAYNNYSSFSEQFAEQFSRSGLSIAEVLNTNSPYGYTVAPALYTFLIDTVRVNGNLVVKAAPEYVLDAGMAISQEMIKKTKGGIWELGAAYAHNWNDKLYLGAGFGIPFVYYNSKSTFTETDTSGTINEFSSFTFRDNFTTQGIGFNAKLGIIYRPQEFWRLGFSLQTPTFMTLRDKRNSYMRTILDSPADALEAESKTFTQDQPSSTTYMQFSPWKAQLSASYVFREVENVKRQRAFISADVEYVNHRGTKFMSESDEPSQEEKNYYKSLTKIVKQQYKGAFNFRVGGEVKFNTVMARLGFGYYGNPYKDSPEKVYKMLLSGGLGYRNKGFFIDLTYVHNINRDFELPYNLTDRLDTYASMKNTTGNIVATFGVKF